MPKVDDVGHSDWTLPKMEVLSRIFDMHISITQRVITKYRTHRQTYRYIDMTAGKGHVPYSEIVSKVDRVHALEWCGKSLVHDDKLLGSPLVFLTIAEERNAGFIYRADLIEANKGNCQELEQAVRHHASLNNWQDMDAKVILHNNTYEEVIPELLRVQDDTEFGLIFIDPSGNRPDFKTLKHISQTRPKMELLLYLPATNIKREFGYTNRTLSDYMGGIGKEYWLIKRPTKGDKFQWTFLLGSSWDKFKDYKRIDFLRLDSDEAQSFFPKLELTARQRRDLLQPKLPHLDSK